MAYVYRHIRLDKNEPFYIGIGSDKEYKRASTPKNRNIFWKRIVNKTEFEVEILCDNINWDEACIKEKEFISLYGRKDKNKGSLCNLTDGGEGVYGLKMSNESKKKMSDARKGKKCYIITNEIRERQSIAAKKRGITNENMIKMLEGKRLIGWGSHRKGVLHTEETRKKISESKTGVKKSEEWCKGQSERVTQYWKNKKQKQ
jgi:hypothetical protein